MAEMKDMYKLTKFVSTRPVNDFLKDGAKDKTDARSKLAIAYVERSKFSTNINGILNHKSKYTQTLAHIVFEAEKRQYLRLIVSTKNGVYYTIGANGLHLLGKKFYFFRVGLWDESLKTYPNLIKLVGGAIVGTIITILVKSLLG